MMAVGCNHAAAAVEIHTGTSRCPGRADRTLVVCGTLVVRRSSLESRTRRSGRYGTRLVVGSILHWRGIDLENLVESTGSVLAVGDYCIHLVDFDSDCFDTPVDSSTLGQREIGLYCIATVTGVDCVPDMLFGVGLVGCHGVIVGHSMKHYVPVGVRDRTGGSAHMPVRRRLDSLLDD